MIENKGLRYWLFAGNHCYPKGGMRDFQKTFEGVGDAVQYARNLEFEWFHVFDSETNEMISNDIEHLSNRVKTYLKRVEK